MASPQREQWGTQAGFIFAAIGSAIGLGNIWRFPQTAYEAGGGTFLLPYLFALLTAAIPLLILDYTIGHRGRGSPPLAYRRLSRVAEPIGWWQTIICFIIATYYAVIVAWAARYALFSLNQQWGGPGDTETFFASFTHAAPEAGPIARFFVPGVGVPLILVWIVALGILALGIRKGIEWANRIFIPLLVILFLTLVIWSLTLDGAVDGLNALFTPEWSRVTDLGVWLEVYGQLFFSLSVAFGIMITYASYLGRRADLTGSALVTGFANSSFEILAGIGVFASLGFMAHSQGSDINDVVSGGVGLAFMTLPAIVSQLPFGDLGAGLFGLLFFLSLVIAGMTSLISIVQVVVSTVEDRTGMRRLPAVLLVGGAIAILSLLLFPTDQGVSLLDTVDHFINQYGIAMVGLVSVVAVPWVLGKMSQLRAHADSMSSTRLSWWWPTGLIITPIVLAIILVYNLYTEFVEGYPPNTPYPATFVVWAGWAVAGAAFVLAIILSLLPWRTVPAWAGNDSAEEP